MTVNRNSETVLHVTTRVPNQGSAHSGADPDRTRDTRGKGNKDPGPESVLQHHRWSNLLVKIISSFKIFIFMSFDISIDTRNLLNRM